MCTGGHEIVNAICGNVIVIPVEGARRNAPLSREGMKFVQAGIAHQVRPQRAVGGPHRGVDKDRHLHQNRSLVRQLRRTQGTRRQHAPRPIASSGAHRVMYLFGASRFARSPTGGVTKVLLEAPRTSSAAQAGFVTALASLWGTTSRLPVRFGWTSRARPL